MSTTPALPLFGDAYMADTRHLTLQEHGAYLLMLIIAWQSPECRLPDDDKRIAQMLGITLTRWEKIKPVVSPFWKIGGGFWTQQRLKKERSFVEKRRRDSKSAARKRWSQLTENNKDDTCDGISDRICESDATAYAPPPLVVRDINNPPSVNAARENEKKRDDPLAGLPAAPAKASPNPMLIRVMEAASFTAPPADGGMLRSWIDDGISLEAVILPTVREVAARQLAKGDPVRRLKFFDDAVREEHASQARYHERIGRIAAGQPV